MRIRSLSVTGLSGFLSFNSEFHDDINVFTGRNGVGKTTLLKLLWYLISGNIERIPDELTFTKLKLTTDRFVLEMSKSTSDTKPSRESQLPLDPRVNGFTDSVINLRSDRIGTTRSTRVVADDQTRLTAILSDVHGNELASASGPWGEETQSITFMNRWIIRLSTNSVFFPTFRRIEGGFSLGSNRSEIVGTIDAARLRALRRHRDTNALEEALIRLSTEMSVAGHTFVASISTSDIASILASRYADASERTNKQSLEMSQQIADMILKHEKTSAGHGSEASQLEHTQAILVRIRRMVQDRKENQEATLKPFTVLSDLIRRIFHHKGIRITPSIAMGDVEKTISSEWLSAGEKQMLGFLAYNAFNSQCPIFIDEPELSLHPDWQRMLFPVLQSQGTGNQFFIATHSPFIYAKYAHREHVLHGDRGNTDAQSQT